MRKIILNIVITIIASFTSSAFAQSPLLLNYADLILHNGQVLTVDENFTVTEALAVRDGKVLGTGSNQDMLALAGPETEKINLMGRTVTPGYIYNDGDKIHR